MIAMNDCKHQNVKQCDCQDQCPAMKCQTPGCDWWCWIEEFAEWLHA